MNDHLGKMKPLHEVLEAEADVMQAAFTNGGLSRELFTCQNTVNPRKYHQRLVKCANSNKSLINDETVAELVHHLYVILEICGKDESFNDITKSCRTSVESVRRKYGHLARL